MDYNVIRYRITEEQFIFCYSSNRCPFNKSTYTWTYKGRSDHQACILYIIRVHITTLHCFVTQLNILQEYYLNNVRLNKR